MTNSSPDMRARVSPERSVAVSRCGDSEQQLVADCVAVEVVHELEPVEIQEQDRGHLARSAGSKNGVVEPLEQEDPVRQPGQRVVQRGRARSFGGVSEIGASLRVEQVGRDDVGQRLGRVQGRRRRAVRKCPGTGRARRAGRHRGAAGTRTRRAARRRARRRRTPGTETRAARSDTATASPVWYASKHGPSPARSAVPRSAAPTRPTPPRSGDCCRAR